MTLSPFFSSLEFVPAVGLALSGGLSGGDRRGAIAVVERLSLLRVDSGREVPSRADEHYPASAGLPCRHPGHITPDDVHLVDRGLIGLVGRVCGEDPDPQWVAVAHHLYALDHDAVAIP